jgi:Family of unknown function (DUF6504)
MRIQASLIVAFVGKAIVPEGALDTAVLAQGEPSLPPAFAYDGARLEVRELRRSWRSTKDDRGDTYVKKHWFEFATSDGRIAVVYFDRGARKGAPRWWLYTLA